MLQQIITILILLLSLAITVRHYWKKYRPVANEKADPCSGCASGCGGCPVLDLKQKIEEKQLEKD